MANKEEYSPLSKNPKNNPKKRPNKVPLAAGGKITIRLKDVMSRGLIPPMIIIPYTSPEISHKDIT